MVAVESRGSRARTYPAPRIVILAIVIFCIPISFNRPFRHGTKGSTQIYIQGGILLRNRESCHRLSSVVGYSTRRPNAKRRIYLS